MVTLLSLIGLTTDKSCQRFLVAFRQVLKPFPTPDQCGLGGGIART